MLIKSTLLSLIMFSFSAHSQLLLPENLGEDVSNTFSNDTLCMSYKFMSGDTLYYKVDASDSIVVNYGKPILRIRKEFHRIIVDSVNLYNRYHISHTMLGYKSKENQGTISGDTKEGSTWKDVTVRYEIDQSGKRYSYGINDSSTAILHPAGAFNPPLFFDIGVFCEKAGSNWVVGNTIELPENGVPFPLLKYTHLFRFRDKKDTLGYQITRLEYTRAAHGSYNLDLIQGQTKTSSKINGFGLLDVAKDSKIPVHHYTTTQQKVTITKPSGQKEKIQHFTEIFYTLDKAILQPRK